MSDLVATQVDACAATAVWLLGDRLARAKLVRSGSDVVDPASRLGRRMSWRGVLDEVPANP